MTNKEKGILSQLYKQVRSKTQKCYNPGCNEMAIRSHIQQVEGAIRRISTPNGKVVQIEDLDPRFNQMPYQFKEKGIKQKGDVLTFWGFCNSCDSKLFKDIESENVNYSIYRNQLLYSYRGFLSELYKQEYNLKWYDLIFKSKGLSDEIKNSFSRLDQQFKLISKMGKTTKLLFEQDLTKNTRNFEFIHLTLPKMEVCTSTTYAFPIKIKIDSKLEKEINTENSLPLISTPIFINLIPENKNLNLILGCLNNKKLKGRIDLEKIKKYNQKQHIKLVSDILIKHIETWFVSVSLYNLWVQRKMNLTILENMKNYRPAQMKTKHIRFNIFQDIY